MALKFSTGLRDMINGLKGNIGGAIVGVGIDFVDGAGGDDTITDSGNGFIAAGFSPGDTLFIQGSTSNDPSSGAVITGVVAGFFIHCQELTKSMKMLTPIQKHTISNKHKMAYMFVRHY